MSFSQNLQFTGAIPPDTDRGLAHPAGASLVRVLQEAAAAARWQVGAIDLWRDCGWSFVSRRPGAEAEIVLAPLEPGSWMLQVAPAKSAGLFGRWRGRRPSASRVDVYDLARVVHVAVARQGGLSGLRWCWDGPPDRRPSSHEPPLPPGEW